MQKKLLLLAVIIFVILTANSKEQQNILKKLLTPVTPMPVSKTIKKSITNPSSQDISTALVKRVVDGDTIELSDGRKVRYIGMNAPESVDPRRAVQCFGKEAALKNKELVEGKEVRMEKDISEIDKYGRLLRYVYVMIEKNEIFVNEYLVKEGYAVSSSYPPDVKYQDIFRKAEQYARENKKGLWSSCK